MKSSTPAAEQEIQRFVSDMGAIFGSAGGSEISGRIMGWLMICDPAEQSLHDIEAAVHASRASVSTVTRMLMEAGFIERAGGQHGRRVMFRVRDEAWATMIERRFGLVDRLIETGKRGRQAIRSTPPETRQRLDEMIDFYGFMRVELTDISNRWRAHRDRRKRNTTKRS